MIDGRGSVFALALATALAMPGAVRAVEDYPHRPISYIIPFAPGGESDVTARHQRSYFKALFDHDLVISYRPGGGGAVGWAQLDALSGDGYTIMGVNLPHIILQPAEKDVGYETDDIAIVYIFQYTPDAIVVPAGSPFQTLQDLIAHAKAHPGAVTFSGSAEASSNHLAQVTFDGLAGIDTRYVPFPGTGDSAKALLGGAVTAAWGYTTLGAQYPDRLRLLAVAMQERHPRFPDVPTFRELGFDMVSGAYRGIAVPQSTPEDIRQKLSDMIGRINADVGFQKTMLDGGFALTDVDYQGVAAFMAQKKDAYLKAARAAGVIK